MWKCTILPEGLSLPHCDIRSNNISIDIRCIQMIEDWCAISFHYNSIYGDPLSKINVIIEDSDSRCVCRQKMLVFRAHCHIWNDTTIKMCRCGYWINVRVYQRMHGIVVPDDLAVSENIVEDYRKWYNEHDNQSNRVQAAR